MIRGNMEGNCVVSGGVCLKETKDMMLFFLVILPCNLPLEHLDSDHPGAMLSKHSWRVLARKGSTMFQMLPRLHGPRIIKAF